MKLHEVLMLPRVLDGTLWFNPVNRKDLPYWINEGIVGVPCYRLSGETRLTSNPFVLAGEWETHEAFSI